VTDPSVGSQDPEMSPAPTITYAELIRRVALIHAAIDEYEMKAIDEPVMRKRAEERTRAS
jgi:hypothetical protein